MSFTKWEAPMAIHQLPVSMNGTVKHPSCNVARAPETQLRCLRAVVPDHAVIFAMVDGPGGNEGHCCQELCEFDLHLADFYYC